ncbi:hypothetical protein ACKKBG_A10110 [Auxenochlorella protothecoides x Auxenochlorella symbiontica]
MEGAEASSITQGPAGSLEEGVTRVFERQQNIGVELADIRRQIAAFNATTSKLATAANKVESTALTFGDVQGFLTAIEAEVATIQAALQKIQARNNGG